MTDIAELIREAREAQTALKVIAPSTEPTDAAKLVFKLADALEALDRENRALAETLNAVNQAALAAAERAEERTELWKAEIARMERLT